MSEEEIIEIIEKLQCEYKEQQNDKKYNDYTVFKAKEYSKGLNGLLDLYNKEKEQNKININSINDLIKECNEENKRCSELAIELQAEKEKNKELEQYFWNQLIKSESYHLENIKECIPTDYHYQELYKCFLEIGINNNEYIHLSIASLKHNFDNKVEED